MTAEPMADHAVAQQRKVTAAVAIAAVVSTMPAFLVGASAVLIRPELAMSEAALGAVISVFFATAALTSIAGGRLAERFGAGQTIVVSVLCSGLSMLAVAVMPASSGWLFLLLAVGGVAHGTTQPATNLALAGNGDGGRRAFQFGIKQAAVPLASLLAGLSVPLLGLTLGWRWTFAVAGLGAASVACVIAVQRRAVVRVRTGPSARTRDGDRPDIGYGPMVALSLAAGMGATAATALPSFLTETAVRAGLTAQSAGWLLAFGSVAGIASRLGVGWQAGALGGAALRTTSMMLVIGAGGYLLIATGSVAAIALGTVIAFSLAWGWTGLFHFAVVTMNPVAPGTASGIGQAGASAGAAVGPFLFGAVAAVGSFRLAWTVAACVAAAAGVAAAAVRSRVAIS